ncbi:hypothetical protein BS17DRAFT_82214 [Gyrodon lividus]|nr:hypothetical protein BS17DRAFT_82214 [Gyrodon lividus]
MINGSRREPHQDRNLSRLTECRRHFRDAVSFNQSVNYLRSQATRRNVRWRSSFITVLFLCPQLTRGHAHLACVSLVHSLTPSFFFR